MILKLKNIFPQLKTSLLPDIKGLALVFSVCISIASCSEDPLSPPPNNDPGINTVAMYEWDIDTLQGYRLDGLYIADTNNIYIASRPPLYYNGVGYTQIDIQDPNFLGSIVSGYDRDNIYFGGVSSSIATIKKWDGFAVTSHSIANEYLGSVNSILPLGPDDLWLSVSEKNRVYHFSSGTFTVYSLDVDSVRGEYFFMNSMGELYLFGYELSNDTDYKYIYKYENDQFTRLSVTATCANCKLFYSLGFCDQDILNVSGYKVFYFNGFDWSAFVNTLPNTFNFPPMKVGGISKTNFMCYYSDAYPYVNSLLIYRDNKWTWEKSLKFIGSYISVSQLSVFENKAYVLVNNIGISYVARGILKK
jgi:hypothetical protein